MNIGKIVSVEFDKFRVKLFNTAKTSTVGIRGKVYYFGNIGSFLKVENSIGEIIICEVISVFDDSKHFDPSSDFNIDSNRELLIKPIGTMKSDSIFHMGVGVFPSIYSDVKVVVEEDVQAILLSQDIQQGEDVVHSRLKIGMSKSLINYPVQISIDKFFNIHTAVIGNSGSGKSNTISHILQEVLRKENYSGIGCKIILFDVNGEYQPAFTQLGPDIKTKFYKPSFANGFEKFSLPYYMMNLDEWSAFLMATDRTQKPFWDKVLQESYKFFKIKTGSDDEQSRFINYFRFKLVNILSFIFSRVDTDTATVTSAASAARKIKDIIISGEFVQSDGVQGFIKDIDIILEKCNLSFGVQNSQLQKVIEDLGKKVNVTEALKTQEIRLTHGEYYDFKFLSVASELILLEENAKGNSRIFDNTATMLSRLEYFMNNSDCEFMKNSTTIYESENDYLMKVFGITEENDTSSQLILLDSSEVNRDILELLTSVVNRMIFDYRKKLSGDSRRLNPIHIVLDEAHRYIKKDADYLMKENIFEKIAREGRKYSLYLLVSSQRPSELSQTVLSQCGNYVIHRIQNEVDMNYIYAVLPYFSSDYISRIKQATPGEALIFGNCVPMPLSVKIEKANPEPNSENCNIPKEWYKAHSNV